MIILSVLAARSTRLIEWKYKLQSPTHDALNLISTKYDDNFPREGRSQIQIRIQRVYWAEIQGNMHWQMESLKPNKGLYDSIHMNTSFDIWLLLLKEHDSS